KLVPGALAPDFIIRDNEGNNFEFHKWKSKVRYKLLLFWSTSCSGCYQLTKELIQWHNEPLNKEKLDIVTVNLGETETEARIWKDIIVNFPGWEHLYAQGGVNSLVANDYAILSTPVMFLIESESNLIVSSPGNFEQLIKDLQKGVNKSIVNSFSDN
ncbi:MAG: redoxin domain-containing protein, partial [Desulfobulbaceae bacterium]|nr:redoxin domain-containing protein [Desulfobulbaceae bacterium]